MLYKYCPVQKKLCQDGKINDINNTITDSNVCIVLSKGHTLMTVLSKVLFQGSDWDSSREILV